MVQPGRSTERVSVQAQTGAKKGEGALACSGSGHLRAPRPPGSRRPAVDSSQAADQMGITRRTPGRSLSPARPILAEEEVTSLLRTPACRLGWGRGWLRATSAGGGCGSRPELPTMVRCLGRRWGPWAAGGDCRRQRSVHPGFLGPDADSGAPQAGRQVRAAANSLNLRGWTLRATG